MCGAASQSAVVEKRQSVMIEICHDTKGYKTIFCAQFGTKTLIETYRCGFADEPSNENFLCTLWNNLE